MTLGQQLREARQRAGITLAQAAELAGFHGRQEVHRYETRAEQVSTGRLERYARLLGLELCLRESAPTQQQESAQGASLPGLELSPTPALEQKENEPEQNTQREGGDDRPAGLEPDTQRAGHGPE